MIRHEPSIARYTSVAPCTPGSFGSPWPCLERRPASRGGATLDVPADYPTIQSAIDAAVNGDELADHDTLPRPPERRHDAQCGDVESS